MSNGLLLRSDIHMLFDLFLLGVDPATGRIVIAPALQAPSTKSFPGESFERPRRRLTCPVRRSWNGASDRWRFDPRIRAPRVAELETELASREA